MIALGDDPRFIEHREAKQASLRESTVEARERYRESLLPYCQCIAEHTPEHVRRHMMRELFKDNLPLGVIAFAFTATAREFEELKHSAPIASEPVDEQDRLAQLARGNYPAYLKTAHWRAVREAALERAENRCALCNCPGPLEVHHRSYERVGAERPADVIALCAECHGRHHNEQEAA